MLEERERLGLNQDQLGALGGVSGRAQRNYEKNERQGDARYLAALAKHGVDVQYVITGERSKPISDTLTPRQRALLAYYDAADEEGKKFIELAAMKASQRPPASDAVSQKNHGSGAIQIANTGGNIKIRRK